MFLLFLFQGKTSPYRGLDRRWALTRFPAFAVRQLAPTTHLSNRRSLVRSLGRSSILWTGWTTEISPCNNQRKKKLPLLKKSNNKKKNFFFCCSLCDILDKVASTTFLAQLMDFRSIDKIYNLLRVIKDPVCFFLKDICRFLFLRSIQSCWLLVLACCCVHVQRMLLEDQRPWASCLT